MKHVTTGDQFQSSPSSVVGVVIREWVILRASKILSVHQNVQSSKILADLTGVEIRTSPDIRYVVTLDPYLCSNSPKPYTDSPPREPESWLTHSPIDLSSNVIDEACVGTKTQPKPHFLEWTFSFTNSWSSRYKSRIKSTSFLVWNRVKAISLYTVEDSFIYYWINSQLTASWTKILFWRTKIWLKCHADDLV